MEVLQFPEPGTRSQKTTANAYSKQLLLFVSPRVFSLNSTEYSDIFSSYA